MLAYRHNGEKVSIIMAANENIKEQTAPAEAAENNEEDDFDFCRELQQKRPSVYY